uniref:RRM domain-containing protein n=1 Tax=Panagrolaimus sp. ES5 TaxID=591445 RepID=A0AC34F228_9BILA
TAPSAPASAPTSATAPAAPTSATAPLAPPSVAAPTAPTSDTAPPAPASVTAPAAPPSVAAPTAPTSWAACVGGGTKSAAGAVPAVTNNGNKNVKLSATTVTNNAAASDVTVKSPSTNVTTTTANGNTSADLESTQDKQQLRHNRRPARARSDFTVHVSKIFKGKKATERDLIADVTKAFQEYGPISHVRVPGRRLADDNESTMYAFVDFQEKEDYEKIFADHEKDNEGRVKLSINLPVLSFDGEVIIAQNRGNRGRNFYRNNRRPFGNQRPAGNNGRFGNGRPPQRYPRYNGQPGNRPPQQIDTRNQSDNRQKENETIKAEN